MNILRIIDEFFFGALEEQAEASKADKLYFYLPMSLVIAFMLYLKVNLGL